MKKSNKIFSHDSDSPNPKDAERASSQKAPTRIDLAGGTLDLWPLYLFYENSITINVAIDLYAETVIEVLPDSQIHILSKDQQKEIQASGVHELNSTGPLPLHVRLIKYFAPERGFRIETNSQAPAGSGLGGSSALAVATSAALNSITDNKRSSQDLIGICRDIEAQVLGIPTGVQDHYSAVYGGLSGWSFYPNEVKRITYPVSLQDLQDRILLFYSGMPRNSGINNWQVFKSQIDGDFQVREQLEAIRTEAWNLHEALQKGSWNDVYRSISNEWEARKKLAPGITTEEIEHLIRFGTERGAKAAKVCGAGGGGCVFLMMDPDDRKKIQGDAAAAGFRLLDFHLVPDLT